MVTASAGSGLFIPSESWANHSCLTLLALKTGQGRTELGEQDCRAGAAAVVRRGRDNCISGVRVCCLRSCCSNFQ